LNLGLIRHRFFITVERTIHPSGAARGPGIPAIQHFCVHFLFASASSSWMRAGEKRASDIYISTKGLFIRRDPQLGLVVMTEQNYMSGSASTHVHDTQATNLNLFSTQQVLVVYLDLHIFKHRKFAIQVDLFLCWIFNTILETATS
jgi:hypothetical protein